MGKLYDKDKYNAIAEVFWENIKMVLKDRELSWNWLAKKLNCNKVRLTTGKSRNQNVKLGTAYEIATALGVTIDYLITKHEAA